MRTVKLVPGGVAVLAVVVLLLAFAGRSGEPRGPVLAAADADLTGHASPEAAPLDGTPSAATPVAGGGRVHRVDIKADDYQPGGLRIRVGDTVRWVNRDGVTHTVSAYDGAFDSGPMHMGGVFSHTFSEPGAYRYTCDLHLEMSGAIVVSGG